MGSGDVYKRQLLNDDKVILGFNIFFDYAFDDSHQRNGAGLEVISSVFDLRSNIYDSTSGIQIVSVGVSEEAMDGWDARLDYHLPVDANARIFAGLFEFENGTGSFEIEGEKYGLNLIGSNIDLEVLSYLRFILDKNALNHSSMKPCYLWLINHLIKNILHVKNTYS